jgi:hypothetical protein
MPLKKQRLVNLWQFAGVYIQPECLYADTHARVSLIRGWPSTMVVFHNPRFGGLLEPAPCLTIPIAAKVTERAPVTGRWEQVTDDALASAGAHVSHPLLIAAAE